MESDVKSCPHCSEEFTTKTSWKDHMLKAHNILAYTCDLCPKTFFDQTDFIHHFDVEHKNDCSRHVCQFCGVSYKWFKFLTKHVRDKHQIEKLMQCSECGEEFYNSVAFKKHLRLKHNGSWKFYKCPKCYRKFTAKELIVLHDRFDHSKRGDQHFRDYAVTHLTNIEDEDLLNDSKKCVKCNLQFSSSIYLMKHFKTAHNKQKYFRCCKCEDAFYNTRAGLSVHLYYEHGVPREHKCNKCRYGHTKTFVNKIRSIKENETKTRSIEEDLPSWAKPFIRKDIPQNVDLKDATEDEINNLKSNIRNVFHVLATVPPSKLRGNTVVDPYLQFYSARKKLSDDLRRDCRRRDEKITFNTDKRPRRRIYVDKSESKKSVGDKMPIIEGNMNGVDDYIEYPVTNARPKRNREDKEKSISKERTVKYQGLDTEISVRPKRSKPTVTYREKTPMSDDDDGDISNGDEIDNDNEEKVDELKYKDDGDVNGKQDSRRPKENAPVEKVDKRNSKVEKVDSVTVNGRKSNDKSAQKSAKSVKNSVAINDENVTKSQTDNKTAQNNKNTVAKSNISTEESKTLVTKNDKITVAKNAENVSKSTAGSTTSVTDNDKSSTEKQTRKRNAKDAKLDSQTGNPEPVFECDECRTKFTDKTEMVKHLDIHKKEKVIHEDLIEISDIISKSTEQKYRCDLCHTDFADEVIFLNHLTESHSSVDINIDTHIYKCIQCGNGFRDKNALNEHMKTHNDCDQCRMTFKDSKDLNQHKLKDHKDLMCDKCRTEFKNTREYNKHSCGIASKDNQDGGGNSDSPVQINKENHFSNEDDLPKTKKVVEPKRLYKCLKCESKFNDRELLLVHIKHAHNVALNKVFKCDQCSAAFKMPDKLKQHVDLKHLKQKKLPVIRIKKSKLSTVTLESAGKFELINNLISNTLNNSMHNCKICYSYFPSKELLQRHIQWEHTKNVNLHKCGQCGHVLYSVEDLEIHMNSSHSLDTIVKWKKQIANTYVQQTDV